MLTTAPLLLLHLGGGLGLGLGLVSGLALSKKTSFCSQHFDYNTVRSNWSKTYVFRGVSALWSLGSCSFSARRAETSPQNASFRPASAKVLVEIEIW